MKTVTFIHAADLHLDSPMVGLKHLPKPIFERLKESTFQSLNKIIDAAIKHRVDFVILAGDLFDGEDRSLRALTRFRKQIERLEALQIPVFIVHGNHDHLDGKWSNFLMPSNAFVFSAETQVKTVRKSDHTSINLYGFSYPKRHVIEKRIDSYIKKEGADFHIGILHGQFEGNSEHGSYAPFSLPDLLAKQFDYWALGHIHKRLHLSEEPPVIYPGNIQGRHKKEIGEKGCYLVTLTETSAALDFIPTSDVIWEEIEVDVLDAVTVSDLYQLCRKKMEEIRKESEGVLLSLKLINVDLNDQHGDIFSSGELLETLMEEEKEEISFVWPVDIVIEEKNKWERAQLLNEADFYGELFDAIDTFHTIDDCLASLYQHSSARKFIDKLSQDEKDQLLKDAESILVQLLKNG